MKRYKVSGTRAVLGHQPGDEFDDVLPEAQEQRLLARGHVKIVEGRRSKSPSKAMADAANEKTKGFPSFGKSRDDDENEVS